MNEVRKKKIEKDIQKNQLMKESEEHLKMQDLQMDKEKYKIIQKQRKLMEFDHKNQRKN